MKEHHILTLSGGKDSAALALYIKDNYPDIHEKVQYCFCDTELEVPEVYEYLNKLEIFLNKPISYLKPQVSFQHIENDADLALEQEGIFRDEEVAAFLTQAGDVNTTAAGADLPVLKNDALVTGGRKAVVYQILESAL